MRGDIDSKSHPADDYGFYRSLGEGEYYAPAPFFPVRGYVSGSYNRNAGRSVKYFPDRGVAAYVKPERTIRTFPEKGGIILVLK